MTETERIIGGQHEIEQTWFYILREKEDVEKLWKHLYLNYIGWLSC